MRSWNLSSVVSRVGGQLGYRRQPRSQKSNQNENTKPFRLTKQECGHCSVSGCSQTFQAHLLRRRSWCWRLWAPSWLLPFCAFSVVITPHFPSVWLMWCQLKISKCSGCSLMSYYTAWSLKLSGTVLVTGAKTPGLPRRPTPPFPLCHRPDQHLTLKNKVLFFNANNWNQVARHLLTDFIGLHAFVRFCN